MSLLTQASLIVTPNAVKASKLYSIIPSNGNGDMDVVRATPTATRVNSLGLIESVAANVPRLNYDGSCPSILVEPQRTNRLLNSDVVVTQSITTAGLQMAVSFYGTGTITFSGTFVGSLVGTGANNRVSIVFTPTTGTLTLTVTGSVTKGQVETGGYATSYIPTLGTSVTRNIDVITRNNVYTNNLITSAGGTWFVELNNNIQLTRDTSGYGIWIGDNNTASTIGNSFNIRHNGGTSRLSINKVVATTLTGLYLTLTNTVKIAIDWNGTTADVFVNGVKVVTGTSFTATNMEFLNSGVGGGCVPKYIKSMMLFPTPLTDSECIALTTL